MSKPKSKAKSKAKSKITVLSTQEREFCRVYHATRALGPSARAAGFTSKQPSKTGRALLQKAPIAKELLRLEREAQDEAGPEMQRELIRQLSVIAFSDVTEFIEQDELGNLELARLDEMDPESRTALAALTQASDGVKTSCRVKMVDKLRAMELLTRILGLGTETVQHELLFGPAGEAAPREEALAAIGRVLARSEKPVDGEKPK